MKMQLLWLFLSPQRKCCLWLSNLLTKVLKVSKWLVNIYLFIPKFRICLLSDIPGVKLRTFLFLRKTLMNKSLDFIAFSHYPNILSFFKNNPNISLPKLYIDLSSEIKELLNLPVYGLKNRPRDLGW